MSKLQLNTFTLGIVAVIILGIIIGLEYIFPHGSGGTLLLTLTFWIALVQGTVAVAAAGDATNSKWIGPLKKELLAFHPLILFMAFLFLFLGLKMDVFPWFENQNRWLNTPFFLTRNFVLLVISYFLARFYAKATLRNSPNKGNLAVLYLFFFVFSESLVAFDWVMSLEYPWVSTLFGGIFFMESFYAGLAIAALIAAYYVKNGIEDQTVMTKVLRDTATFTFGFSLAWAGLFYSQFLVIWYGNLPEETSYLVRRMHYSPYDILFYLSIFLLFIAPFVGLISKRAKVIPNWVRMIALVVLAGVFIERILFILPDASMNVFSAILETVLMGFLLLLFFVNRERVMGYAGTERSDR